MEFDLWDGSFNRICAWDPSDRTSDLLLEALNQQDEEQAIRLLRELQEPLSERLAASCLLSAMEQSLELFRQVLEHCEPGEYGEQWLLRGGKKHQAVMRGRGSLLLLAAMMDRPRHAQLLLEHGYDCNGAGLGIASGLWRMRMGWGDTVPPYADHCGAFGNWIEWVDREAEESAAIACATPLAAALLCGSLQTAEVLLSWPGIWKGESSAVCRAAVMVLENKGNRGLSEERRRARQEILRLVLCPERQELPDADTLLHTYYLQPACFADFCRVRTLRGQLESGLCGEEDARRILEPFAQDSWAENRVQYFRAPMGEGELYTIKADGSARVGKLLLIKRFFPQVCRQSWVTGVFLRELLRRSKADEPRKTLRKAWQKLCGEERDLTWAGQSFWMLRWGELRRFLAEVGEGGQLVMDADALPAGYAWRHTRCMSELLNRVHFRRRGGEGISRLMQELLEAGNWKLLQQAIRLGLLAEENPQAVMQYLTENNRVDSHARAAVLTFGENRGEEEAPDKREQEPRRWDYWRPRIWVREEESQEDLRAVLSQELSPEERLERMYRLERYRRQEGEDFLVEDSRYPRLQTNSLCGIACCGENGKNMGLLLKYMPDVPLNPVKASWEDQFFFEGSPLALAAALGRTEQVRLLLERGSHPDEIGRGDCSRFFMRRNFTEVDGAMVTPLLAAILFGEEETARMLLDCGAVCDFSNPAHRQVLRLGSASSLALAGRLPGVGFEKIPEQELEKLRFNASKCGAKGVFWSCMDTDKE